MSVGQTGYCALLNKLSDTHQGACSPLNFPTSGRLRLILLRSTIKQKDGRAGRAYLHVDSTQGCSEHTSTWLCPGEPFLVLLLLRKPFLGTRVLIMPDLHLPHHQQQRKKCPKIKEGEKKKKVKKSHLKTKQETNPTQSTEKTQEDITLHSGKI